MKKNLLLLLSGVLLSLFLTSCACCRSGAEKEAVSLIREGKAECVLLKDGKIIHTEKGRGVSPLLRIYEKYPSKMQGSRIVDKVIGRAAGMIAILGKAESVHGEVVSKDAVLLLEKHGIKVSHTLLVERILNRRRNDLCPLEKSVQGIEDPQKALASMKKAISAMMRQNKK